MSDTSALSPEEAAYIAANVYFTLEGWEAHYLFKAQFGSQAKGAPKPRPGLAANDVVQKNVTGPGPISISKTGIKDGSLVKSFSGSSGSNLLGRTKSGYGYLLQFERGGKRHLVIAVRGTRPEMGYPDLLTDANISTKRNMPFVGPVHAGFYDVYKSILPTLKSANDLISSSDVVHCVGHSLGGAVANLVALHMATKGANTRLYTFGAPRVGLIAAQYDKVINFQVGEKNIYRVSHNFDPIPMIPVAPFIHAHPKISDKNNIFIGSPMQSITIDNHDTEKYIKSVRGKNWTALRAEKLKQGYLDKQYFNSWRNSESWLKRYIGLSINAGMAILQRVLQGLIDTIGIGFTEIATILDLLVMAIKNGLEIFKVAKNHITKFISDCAKMFGMAIEISKQMLSKLLRKLLAEITITAKMAITRASKAAKSKEFKLILSTATPASIGLLLI